MKLRLETIPVRVRETGKESGEAITYQLTENLQREDLNPMDQAKHPDPWRPSAKRGKSLEGRQELQFGWGNK